MNNYLKSYKTQENGGIGISLGWKSRFKISLSMLIVLLAIFILGSYTQLEPSEAEELRNRVEGNINELKQTVGLLPGIFLNNMRAALIMTIPVIGVVLGALITYTTGLVISAYSIKYQIEPILLVTLPFLTVYGLFEFIAYGMALAEGLIIVYSIIKKNLRIELKMLPKVIGLVALILLVAAVIEYAIIETLS